MYVIVGLHQILPERLEEYLPNVTVHAKNSSAEPGCVRYEVLQDDDDPTTVCLIEVFESEAALAAHRETEHYDWWMGLSREWRDPDALRRHAMHYVTPEPS